MNVYRERGATMVGRGEKAAGGELRKGKGRRGKDVVRRERRS